MCIVNVVDFMYVLGSIGLEPFYTEDGGEASSSDGEDNETPRWCTVRRNCGVSKYGDASAYIGLGCTMNGQSGTIAAVMRNSDVRHGELHFAVRVDGDDASFSYIPCKDMMSTNKKNKYKVRVCLDVVCKRCASGVHDMCVCVFKY
jgi:hypothetical protein